MNGKLFMKKIKKLLFYYNSLSILKKFLLAPILGILLIIPFYVFIFLIMLDMKQSVNIANTELIPLNESSYRNILLLEKIVNEMNSAVSAKETEWIYTSDKNADKIRENLDKYINSSYKKEIALSISAFNDYYKKAQEVSANIIQSSYQYKNIEDDTKILVQNYNKVNKLFNDLKAQTKEDIEKNINSLFDDTNLILLNGNFIFFVWFFISFIIIFLVYKDLSYKMKKIINDSKEIAQGDVNFEKRLNIVSYDELGKIVKSINIFINKLHKSHEKLEKAKEELDRLYVVDRLTNVYNRVKIDEIIKIELKKKRRYNNIFSIILIDIDYFKLVNDTYGHLVGDLILKEFAQILKESVRDTDFVGRWGGEEFIIICTQTDIKGSFTLAQNIRAAIEEFDFTTVGKKTASFGISECTDNDNENSIIENADKALYQAKRDGRNKVVCYN